MFLGFGLAALHIADRDLPMGTLMRMGPGNFPAWLGAILSFFGLFIAARGLWRLRPEEIRGRSPDSLQWTIRPVACIVGAMVAFGFVMPRYGLVPALLAMFLVNAFAARDIRWGETVAVTLVLTAFAVIVFVGLLKLPFQLFPGVYLV